MAISFTEVSSTGDALPNDRHELKFPNIAGVMEGNGLTLRHTTVSLPPIQIGQIVVKQLGWSLSFAGLRVQQNTFSVEFVETVDAPVIKSLFKWQDICAGIKTHQAKMKSDYAVKAQCRALDTTGKAALIVDLLNVWPVNVTYGQFSEESSAARVQCEFSVDAVDVVGLEFNNTDFSRSVSASQGSPTLSYASTSGASFSSGSIGSFNIYDSVLKQLGINSSNVSSVLSRFF
jgi:hypothetical protein